MRSNSRLPDCGHHSGSEARPLIDVLLGTECPPERWTTTLCRQFCGTSRQFGETSFRDRPAACIGRHCRQQQPAGSKLLYRSAALAFRQVSHGVELFSADPGPSSHGLKNGQLGSCEAHAFNFEDPTCGLADVQTSFLKLAGGLPLLREPLAVDDGGVAARSKLTVVFADDDQGMRTLFGTLLKLVDTVEVVGEAIDGQVALELVREKEPDLVLLDVNMPKLSGLEAAQMIRTMRPDTHVVLHTAAPTQKAKDTAQRLGIPLLDKMKFDDVIEAITGHHTSDAPPSSQPDPQIEAAILGALTARTSQPMFLVLPAGEVPFYNVLAADLLGLPLPARPSTIDALRSHFNILRPDGTLMAVGDRLMYRAIAAQNPLTEIVIVEVADRQTTCRAAAVPFFSGDQQHVATAIYFEPLEKSGA